MEVAQISMLRSKRIHLVLSSAACEAEVFGAIYVLELGHTVMTMRSVI